MAKKLDKIKIDDEIYDIGGIGGAGDVADVKNGQLVFNQATINEGIVANPTLVGDEQNLSSLQIENIKYKIKSGDKFPSDIVGSKTEKSKNISLPLEDNAIVNKIYFNKELTDEEMKNIYKSIFPQGVPPEEGIVYFLADSTKDSSVNIMIGSMPNATKDDFFILYVDNVDAYQIYSTIDYAGDMDFPPLTKGWAQEDFIDTKATGTIYFQKNIFIEYFGQEFFDNVVTPFINANIVLSNKTPETSILYNYKDGQLDTTTPVYPKTIKSRLFEDDGKTPVKFDSGLPIIDLGIQENNNFSITQEQYNEIDKLKGKCYINIQMGGGVYNFIYSLNMFIPGEGYIFENTSMIFTTDIGTLTINTDLTCSKSSTIVPEYLGTEENKLFFRDGDYQRIGEPVYFNTINGQSVISPTSASGDITIKSSDVIANNTETTTENLNKLKVGDINYDVGGSEITFSDTASATGTDLKSIIVGEDVWKIPAGGSSSISQATETQLGGVKLKPATITDGTFASIDNDGFVKVPTLTRATNMTLGGVKAINKTEDMTQPIGIDTSTGFLYTKAGGGGKKSWEILFKGNKVYQGDDYYFYKSDFPKLLEKEEIYISMSLHFVNVNDNSDKKNYLFEKFIKIPEVTTNNSFFNIYDENIAIGDTRYDAIAVGKLSVSTNVQDTLNITLSEWVFQLILLNDTTKKYRIESMELFKMAGK